MSNYRKLEIENLVNENVTYLILKLYSLNFIFAHIHFYLLIFIFRLKSIFFWVRIGKNRFTKSRQL